MTDAEVLLQERGSKHGDFTHGAQFTQDVMDIFARQANWRLLEAFQKEGIHMIVHKMQRVMVGQFDYDDHWLDIEGYARCVRERLHLLGGHHLAFVSTGAYNDMLIDLASVVNRQPNSNCDYRIPAMTILRHLASLLAGRDTDSPSSTWLGIEKEARWVFDDIRKAS